MVEIRITYETLFDLLRREKNREELQSLDPDFYEQVISYLKEKESVLKRKEDSLFASAEREKLKIQFQNIRRIVKELYERREKKIINIALMKARTGSDIIDTSSLLLSEKEYFIEQVSLFSKFKEDVLNRIINLKGNVLPDKEPHRQSSLTDPRKPEEQAGYISRSEAGQDGRTADDEDSFTGSGDDGSFHYKTNASTDDEPLIHQAAVKADNKTKVKIKDFLPKFMGKQGEVLGPFNKDDIVSLDSQIADLLLKKGRAEVI